MNSLEQADASIAQLQAQVAELTKANHALQRTIARLSTNPDLTAYLGYVLLETAEQVNADSNALFLYDEAAQTLTMRAFMTNGTLIDIGTDPRLEIWRHPVPANISPAWEIISGNLGVLIHEVEPHAPNAWQHGIPWHTQMGHKTVLCVPLRAGDRAIGFMGLCFCDRAIIAAEKIALARSLADQATLALELTRLADAAKQTAIAREQERLAQKRAMDLERANAALQSSLNRLAADCNLDGFLSDVFLEIARSLQADRGALFLYDPSSDVMRLRFGVEQEQLLQIAQMSHFTPFLEPLPLEKMQAWSLLHHNQPLQLTDLTNRPERCNSEAPYWQDLMEWHQQMGHQACLCLPLTLAQQPLGFMSFAFTQPVAVPIEVLELVQSLVHQGTLVVRLTQLVEQAKTSAIYEERNRLAREIHDTLAQSFTGISLQLGVAQRLLHTQPDEVLNLLNDVNELARVGLAEARRSVWELQPDAEKYQDLVSILDQSIQQMTSNTSIQPEFAVQGVPYLLSIPIGMNLLRIAQEALTNTLRHAQAQTIRVTLIYEPSRVRLRVQDDGQGFVPARQRDAGGFGLIAMQQRCDRLDGLLTITSQPGNGTEITVEVPIIPPENQEFS
jgi:signal transduction histidine kinase